MIEEYLNDILQYLFISPAISSFRILKRETGEEDGYIRIKCILSDGSILEFAEYVRDIKKKVYIDTYSYHWQTAYGKLIKRWDNVSHHRSIDTFPFHVHLSEGRVEGSVAMTLKKVLAEVEKAMPKND